MHTVFGEAAARARKEKEVGKGALAEGRRRCLRNNFFGVEKGLSRKIMKQKWQNGANEKKKRSGASIGKRKGSELK